MLTRNIRLVIKNTVGHSLAIVISLVFSIAGARWLSAADFGELRYIITLLPLFVSFSLPSYDLVILRNTCESRHVSLRKIFSVRFMCALLGTIIILGAAYVFRHKTSETLSFFLIVSAILLPLYETGTGFRNYLIGTRLQKLGLDLTIFSRIASLIGLAVLFFLIYYFKLNRLYVFPAYLFAMIVPTLLTFFVVVKSQEKRTLKETINADIKSAISATLAGVVYLLVFSLDKIIVRHDLGAEQLAGYAILIMAPQELSKLFDATVPLFYRKLFFGKQKFEMNRLLKLFLLFPFAALIYSAIFYEMSDVVFGDQYKFTFTSVAISSVMIASLSFEYLNNHRIFVAYGPRALFFYSIFNLFLSVPILLVGLSAGGIDGLMMGLILKQIAAPSAFLLVKKRFLPMAQNNHVF